MLSDVPKPSNSIVATAHSTLTLLPLSLLFKLEWAPKSYWCGLQRAIGVDSKELKSLLRELIGSLRTHFFELLARGEPFSRSKTGTREAPIGPKSCPSFVCCHQKNNSALLEQVDGAEHCKYAKNSLKKRLL